MAFDRYQLLAPPQAAGVAAKNVGAKAGTLIWEVRVRFIDSTFKPPTFPFALPGQQLPPRSPQSSSEHFVAAGDTELALHASICARAGGVGTPVGDVEPLKSTPPTLSILMPGNTIDATNTGSIATFTA